MVKIRPYGLDDIEVVVQLWWQTWHQTFPDLEHPQRYTSWQERFRKHIAVRGLIWVAEVENQIVGFVVVVKEEGRLDQLFVAPAYQHRGIGSALLGKAKEICPQKLTTDTLQRNTQSRKFYEKHGFKAGKLAVNKNNGQPNIEYYWSPL